MGNNLTINLNITNPELDLQALISIYAGAMGGKHLDKSQSAIHEQVAAQVRAYLTDAIGVDGFLQVDANVMRMINSNWAKETVQSGHNQVNELKLNLG